MRDGRDFDICLDTRACSSKLDVRVFYACYTGETVSQWVPVRAAARAGPAASLPGPARGPRVYKGAATDPRRRRGGAAPARGGAGHTLRGHTHATSRHVDTRRCVIKC